MLPIFPNDYQRARAVLATLFNAALLSRDTGLSEVGIDYVAKHALYAAETLLDNLGVIDPDKK